VLSGKKGKAIFSNLQKSGRGRKKEIKAVEIPTSARQATNRSTGDRGRTSIPGGTGQGN
jgi:hypothetical protein